MIPLADIRCSLTTLLCSERLAPELLERSPTTSEPDPRKTPSCRIESSSLPVSLRTKCDL
jgi:hypothetical protein